MSKTHKKTILSKERNDTGLSNQVYGRFINKDGRPNVSKTGVGFFESYSGYHTLLLMPRHQFILLLLLCYIVVNLFFAVIYYVIGIDHLTGIDRSSPLREFVDVFFFSAQTFTTVGYGRIAPVGALASLVATFEAFLGLLGFAIATGLFYGRFSHPKAHLKFSQNAIIAPFEEGKALMFRTAPFKNNSLSDAEVTISLALEEKINGELKSRFYLLETTLRKINTFNLNWTIVHKIDENSPFFGFTEEDFQKTRMEIMVMIKAFDEVFANTVMQRTSYISSEIVYGAKFLPLHFASGDQQKTIMDLGRINAYEKVKMD